jgi:hypothetical protein
MPENDLPDRIRLNAEAVRIGLNADAVPRIARAVTPTLARLAEVKLSIPLDVEPSSFAVIQRGEIGE